MTTTARKLTQADFLAEAVAKFGKNPLKWAFICPSCGDTATGQDFRDALAKHPRTNLRTNEPVTASDVLGQECIGRTLGALDSGTKRGCDWAAYGLFSGPWTITLPNGHQAYSFPFAPALPEAAVTR